MMKAPEIQKKWGLAPHSQIQPQRGGLGWEKLFDVFPKRRVKSPSNDHEAQQEDQHPHANANP
jgi:hypothetical protein